MLVGDAIGGPDNRGPGNGCARHGRRGNARRERRPVNVVESIGAGEGELDIIIWPGYAEDGSNVASYDWVHPFETKTGCQIKTRKEAGSSDEMVSLIRQGGYDGLSASATPRSA